MSPGTAHAAPSPVRVAFQGEPAAFGEEAIRHLFGSRARPVPCHGFADVRAAILSGEADCGVLPIENTIAGTVAEAAAIVRSPALQVVGDVVRPIRQCLIGVPGATLARLGLVRSHPIALAQCTRFLAAHPGVRVVVDSDTAGAARAIAAARDPAQAAIAGHAAAQRYGLAILVEGIQDRADNRTRFVVVRRREVAAPLS
ncbi:MAG TPA: prephenate dehydratase domain-containing protein [Longimicrobiales bacterium]